MIIGSQKEDFITIFQSEYEKPTLIWKKEMTDILKNEILNNCNTLIKDLKNFNPD